MTPSPTLNFLSRSCNALATTNVGTLRVGNQEEETVLNLAKAGLLIKPTQNGFGWNP